MGARKLRENDGTCLNEREGERERECVCVREREGRGEGESRGTKSILGMVQLFIRFTFAFTRQMIE